MVRVAGVVVVRGLLGVGSNNNNNRRRRGEEEEDNNNFPIVLTLTEYWNNKIEKKELNLLLLS